MLQFFSVEKSDNGRGEMMKRERSLLLAPYLVLIPVVIAMFYALAEFVLVSKIELFDVRSPLIFCFLVAICLLFFMAWSLIADFKAIRKGGGAEGKSSVVSDEDLLRIIFFVFGLIAYVLLLPRLHFQITTIIFMAVAAFLLNDSDKLTSRLLKSLISSVILVPAVYYIFYKVFAVFLP